MTKPSELRLLAGTDRAQRLDEARKELFNLRFQLATGRLDNLSRIGVVRREIARLLTLEREETATAESPKRRRRRRG
jgi:large subunit ribosomal protein L29